MSFITNIGKWVKGWRLDKFFKGLVNGDKEAGNNLQLTVEKATELVQKIKEYLKSPVGDIITYVIPATWDDELREKAIAFLKKVTSNMAVVSGCFDANISVGEQLACVYNKIESLNDDDEIDSFWHKLGVLATKVFADGKLTFSDAVIAAQFVYETITKKK